MEGIERVLLKMLPNQEGRNKYFIFSMQSKWEQICGANVAKHSKPVRLERKVLYINTDSSVWASHLLMMKQQFINNINRVMTNDPVKDIKFFTGSIENFLQLPKEEQEVKLNFKPLTESEKIFIRQALVNINNQELQKKLAHFRKVCLQRKKALLIENNDMKCKYCGAALIEKNDLCRVCQRYEKEKLRTAGPGRERRAAADGRRALADGGLQLHRPRAQPAVSCGHPPVPRASAKYAAHRRV